MKEAKPVLFRKFKANQYEEVFYNRYMIEDLPMEIHYAEKGLISIQYVVCLN